jgi:uncharacterized membrane protein (UPF0127 family)
MRKYIIYLIILLSGILLVVFWLIFSNNENQGSDVIKSEREKQGPEFKNEGQLFFINPQSADTVFSLFIEIADSQEKISRGLMYRSNIESNQSMLFIFNAESEQSFWMKNTKVPLDIIFINSNYKIVHIAKHTIPYSKDPIPSMKPARYVLEVKAGLCDENRIEEGFDIQFIINNSLSL